MAEILFAARNLPSGQLRGEPIAVKETGEPWSALELLPFNDGGSYARVIITDATKAQVKRRLKPLFTQAVPGVDPEAFAPDEVDRRVRRANRRWRLRYDLLPNGVQNRLRRDGFYETTVAQVKGYITRKVWNGNNVVDGTDSEFDLPED